MSTEGAFQRSIQQTDLFDELFLSSSSLIGVRTWDSDLQARTPSIGCIDKPIRVSNNLLVCLSCSQLREANLVVAKGISDVRDLERLNAHFLTRQGDASERDTENLASWLEDVVGPWSPEEVWVQIFEQGLDCFKRRVDHRVMAFKSLVVDRNSREVAETLTGFLQKDSLTVDQALETDIGRIMADCDMFVLDVETSHCHLASPYLRSRLQALADSWNPRSMTSSLRRFLGL